MSGTKQGNEPAGRRIPNEFHFVFGLRKQREPFHLAHYLCLESCRQVNRPAAIHFYYHYPPFGALWDRIRPHLTLEKVSLDPRVDGFRYRDARMGAYRYAHHADFIRLALLLERGGVYADIDTLFVRPLPARLFQHDFVMGREGEVWDPRSGAQVPSLCNAFLMSAPGAAFGKRWLARMPAEFDGTWSNHSTLFPQRLADEFPDEIHIEPQRSFFYLPPTILGLAALFEDRLQVPEEVYSLHLWEHLWWDEARVDFSDFHAGLLTAEFVRRKDTTYSRLARPFLPLVGEDGDRDLARRVWRRRVRNLRARAQAELRAALGLALYPLLQRYLPTAAPRLALARAHQAYKVARRRFTVRNGTEEAVLRHVIQWDEYRMFTRRLGSGDVVIDIGAHIGTFSFACHLLGSRSIHAFEADAANFALLERNLRGLSGIETQRGAVFRSDAALAPGTELLHSGPIFSNTGGGGVLFGERHFDYLGHGAIKPEMARQYTPVVALDDILRRFEHVHVMKLDCEGSEFPILLTSRELQRVDRIVGEYHVVREESMALLVPEARIPGYGAYRPEHLKVKLEAEGFAVTMTPGSVQGYFEARRA